MNKSIKEKGIIVSEGIAYRARKRFLLGNWVNPYCTPEMIPYGENELKIIMAKQYELELEKLKRERLCPCCGQYTYGDIEI